MGTRGHQGKVERAGNRRASDIRGLELMRAMRAPIVEALADGVCIVRASDARVLYADPKLNRMLGREAGTHDGEPLSMLHETVRDVRDGSDTDLVKRLQRYGEATVEVRMVRTDGVSIWCRVRAHAFDGPDGAAWVLLHENITDLKKSDEVRKKEETRFRKLVDAGVVGVVTADAEGRILEANDFYLQLVGHTRVELARDQVRWDVLTAPEHRERSAEAVAELRATGRFGPFEKELLRRDGRRVRILVGGASLDASSSECVVFVVPLDSRCA